MWIRNLYYTIRQHRGLINSFLSFVRTDELKFGCFVGKDRMGNRYYENSFYFFGRDRWVVYSNKFGYDYDGSQVDCQWFRWLHNMTDYKPYQEKRPAYKWLLPHLENMTGTKDQYVPYSTSKPKIIPWVPPKTTASN